MKRVIITGGTGFIGANLAEKMVGDGHDVYLLVREGYQSWRIGPLIPHLTLVCVDFMDRNELLEKIKKIRPDWVFHLATYGGYSWQDNLDIAIQTNLLNTINLIEVCRKIGFEVFINTGSSSEYGVKPYAPAENEFLEPNSYYAVTKASATMFCVYTARNFNLPIFSFRLYSVYGPYESPGRLIPNLILKGMQGIFPPLVNPDVARDFIFTEDVNNAYLTAALEPGRLSVGGVYNVGTGNQLTLRDLIGITRNIFTIDALPEWGSMKSHPWDTDIWVADNAKLLSTGWIPQFDFQTGFRKTIDWFKQNAFLVEKIYH